MTVATREGGVDRNFMLETIKALVKGVATREGGVDRNSAGLWCVLGDKASPPARVAWIETALPEPCQHRQEVATREGGVDRNTQATPVLPLPIVATREGGVDRNLSPQT